MECLFWHSFNMADIKTKVADYIEEHRLLLPGDEVTVGVSGGADSVCLLLLLDELKKDIDLIISAVYVEHGIRGEESLADGEYVRELCKKLDIPFKIKSVDVKGHSAKLHISTEEAARQLRYEALFEDGASIVAVAHNADDNAETIIYRMARGTGIKGMCGMRPSRRYEDGRIIRPLLCCERSEIEGYLKKRGIAYRTDSTNNTDDYARNRIRHQILPILKELNHGTVRHINALANEINELYLNEEKRADENLSESWGEDSLSRSALLELNENERRGAIRRWLIAETGGRDISRTHIDAAIRLIGAGTGKEISLPGGIKLCAEYDRLLLKRERRSHAMRALDEVRLPFGAMSVGDTCELEVGKTVFSFKLIPYEGGEIPLKGYAKWFDYDKITNDLVIRTRQAGDFITIDREGHRSKFQDFCINEKMTREDRDTRLLLCEGSEVLMIAGGRRGENALVDEGTSRVLEVTVETVSD